MIIKSLIKNLQYKICTYEKRAQILRTRGVKIGKNSEVYPSANFGSEPYLIELGNDVRIASGVKLTTHDGGLWVLRNSGKLENADKFGKIKIGNNVHIGMDSIIMPGVSIGDNVIIGCASVVTKDIPSNSVAVGIPAKVIESIDEYYNKNKNKVVYTKNMSPKEKREYIERTLKIENKIEEN